jgi:electron transfer flavoprotein alpha subunit
LKKSLIYFEPNHFQNSVDLLEVVHQIYGSEEYETYAVSFGSDFTEAEGLFDYLIEVPDVRIRSYDVICLTNVLEELQQCYHFDSILFPATQQGRMLAPRTAMRLQVGLVADVTAIQHKNGVVEMIRPAFSGKIMAAITNRNRVPLMMSVRQNVFSYQEPVQKHTVRIEYLPKQVEQSNIELIEIQEKEAIEDIRESEILISGGGGTIRYFNQLKMLAAELNAQVSASRKAVDCDIAPRSIQVGQSGKTVSPRLYMALGIKGALQHMEGLKNVENIISVNINKDAPICSLSDIVVEGDAREFIERLTDKIKQEK